MISIPVTEPTHVAEARRRVAALGATVGFGEDEFGRTALVVSELATNLLKHGGGGEILAGGGAHGLDILSLDRGPGMRNAAACAEDGYSTSGTLGHGLGAVRRQSDAMALASWPGLGTVVATRIGTRPVPPARPGRRVEAIAVPKSGEDVSGDAWSLHQDGHGATLFVVDGLGHGPEAARAAHEAVLQFQRSRTASPAQIVDDVHHAIRATRGGAIAAARVDAAVVGFAGLGNIAGVIVGRDGAVKRMVSHAGTAGHNARRIQAFDYPHAGGLLVMHSDGIDTRWTLDRYPGALQLPPMLVAALLYRDHGRGRDDATVVVAEI